MFDILLFMGHIYVCKDGAGLLDALEISVDPSMELINVEKCQVYRGEYKNNVLKKGTIHTSKYYKYMLISWCAKWPRRC